MESPTEYLRGFIAQNGGTITLERFMQEALHHPEHGYYAHRIRDIGPRGDFATSATLHPALAQAVAFWAAAHRGEIAERGAWHVIELGGGGGQMAAAFFDALVWFARRRLTYHIVETSGPLRAVQAECVQRFHSRVRWHAGIADALAAANRRALIFSNEFADAFPCVQLSRDENAENGWREVAVSWPPDAPAPMESLIPWPGPGDDWPRECSALSAEWARCYPPRQRIEIHVAYWRWLQSWLPEWRAGRMLTIDYGDTFPELYYRRPHGTLRGFAHHQRQTGEEVYRHFGQQDLTADVNFTDLQQWGAALWMTTAAFENQAAFLRASLPTKSLARRAAADPALAYLLDETGPGSAFKVLEQRR